MKREELVKIVGEENVEKLENEPCEPSGRVGYNGASQFNDFCEWVASIQIDVDDLRYNITAYYYTTNKQDNDAEIAGTWDVVDFIVHHYTCEQV